MVPSTSSLPKWAPVPVSMAIAGALGGDFGRSLWTTSRSVKGDDASAPASAAGATDGDAGSSITIPLEDVPGSSREESFIMMFTCNVCETRSARQISKQAYNHGSVLVRCPGCDSLHLIADNLDWFKLGKVKLEDILAAQGQDVVDGNVYDLSPEDLEVLAREASTPAPEPVGERMPREPVE